MVIKELGFKPLRECVKVWIDKGENTPMLVGERVAFTESVQHKRCMDIEIEYVGTIVSLEGDVALVAVDQVDGVAIDSPVCKAKPVTSLEYVWYMCPRCHAALPIVHGLEQCPLCNYIVFAQQAERVDLDDPRLNIPKTVENHLLAGERVTFTVSVQHIEVKNVGTLVILKGDVALVAVDEIDGVAIYPPMCKAKRLSALQPVPLPTFFLCPRCHACLTNVNGPGQCPACRCEFEHAEEVSIDDPRLNIPKVVGLTIVEKL
jgi:hypothetical protein